jgi:hypothetical protein
MKDESICKSLETIARANIPESTNLWPRLSARLERKHPRPMDLKWKLVWTILLVLLGLSALTGVVYAIGRMTGYIPGIGFVQTSSLRVLAKPVSQTRAGVTVTIEQVIVDSKRTVVVYKTEGLTIAAANSKGEGASFGSAHLLRLPDGTTLEETPDIGYAGTPEPLINDDHTQGGWPNYMWRLVYPPVPPQVNELTLLIPILQTMPAGAAPENWNLTFHVKPAPADETFSPITVFGPTSQTVNVVTPPVGATVLPAFSNVAAHAGFTFQLENVVELADGFVLTGSLSWTDAVYPSGKGMLSAGVTPRLTDSNNQNIPVEEVQLANGSYVDEHKIAWSFRTNRKNFSGPLVISIPEINATLLPPQADFELDLGSSPQLGRGWEVNRDFVFAGHTLRLLSVQLTGDSNPCWKSDIVFNFASDEDGIFASVNDVVPQQALEQACSGGGGGGGGPVDPKVFSTGTTYSSIPTGLHHFTISASIPYLISGPWQVTWNPPSTKSSTPTAEPGACLTLEKWNQLVGRNDSLPAGVGGKILTTVNEGGPLPAIFISNLDGTNARKIDTGAWASSSSDGTRLAYSAADGLHILDLSTGQSSSLGTDGYGLHWSPDNKRIMYTTTFDLYEINADGSGLQKIDTGSAQVVSTVGWLPDNQTIVYGLMGGDGFTFTTFNLQSRETKKLFSFRNKAGYGAISPDGQWIVFSDKIFGAQNWGIFIARLDGTERKLVAEPEVPTAFISVWGPGGKWLVLNTQTAKSVQIPVLVDPFTCQAVHLQNVNGMVEGWSP